MKPKLNKLALSIGVAAGLATASMPSHAVMGGVAGEAQLVPFALWDPGIAGPVLDGVAPDLAGFTNINSIGSVNTLVEITVPAAMGLDTVPNLFTASHTTPTEFPNPILPAENTGAHIDQDLAGGNAIHWYFFDEESKHVTDGSIPVTADDFYLFNWGTHAEQKNLPNLLRGVKGYLVFTTEVARDGSPADFSFFADSYMVFPIAIGLIDAKIPTLALNDGQDIKVGGVVDTQPTIDNQVIYDGNIPVQVSPLISGMRTNFSDGIPDKYVFDLTLSDRWLPTLHVLWNDGNYGDTAQLVVYDHEEHPCSDTQPLPNELNVVWVSNQYLEVPIDGDIVVAAGGPPQFAGKKILSPPLLNLWGTVTPGVGPLAGIDPANNPANWPGLPWLDAARSYCYPDGATEWDIAANPGFVRYVLPEPYDNNVDVPETAGVAFSVQLQFDIDQQDLLDWVITGFTDPLESIPQILPVETALGHERGKFK